MSGADSVLVQEDDTWSWTNPVEPADVSGDLAISAIDALLLINFLNSGQNSELPPLEDRPEFFFDVSGDGFVSAVDALTVINILNTNQGSAEGEDSSLPGSAYFDSEVHSELDDERKRRYESIDRFFQSL